MSEAVRYYTRDTRDSREIRKRKETSEDSGVESGHSLENNGKINLILIIYGLILQARMGKITSFIIN